jgi:hypothetical protein
MDPRLLDKLLDEASDFVLPPGRTVPRVHRPSSTLFLREFVGRNQPCVATGLLDDEDEWPALRKWQDHGGLCAALDDGQQVVSIDATPSGFGDAVICHPVDQQLVFVQPEKRSMHIGEFLAQLDDASGDDDVLYLSHQNDNLRVEMPALMADIAAEGLPLALDAFGNSPDAINLWIGDARAVSTMHRDNYENMYCVVKGEKVFDLLPPCCAPLLPMVEVRNGIYRKHEPGAGEATEEVGVDQSGGRRKSAWTVDLDDDPDSVTMWTRFDVENPDIGVGATTDCSSTTQQPLDVEVAKSRAEASAAREKLKSMVCRVHVRAGEVLYLPAMW